MVGNNYFFVPIAFADSRLAALFSITKSLPEMNNIVSYLQGCSEEYAWYLADKVACIHSVLNFKPVQLEVIGMKSCKGIWGMGGVGPDALEEVDTALVAASLASSVLDQCPS